MTVFGNQKYDAIVLGAGPAGSATSTFLAQAGKKVLMIDKRPFPRHKIGESLLPASNPLFKELGIADKLVTRFLAKPGGKWVFQSGRELLGNFSRAAKSNFSKTPKAYMVDRERFDTLLLQNAIDHGVRVDMHGAQVHAEAAMSVGVTCNNRRIAAPMIFDCSGPRGLISKEFNLRKKTRLDRKASYSYYTGSIPDKEIRENWFVGIVIPDGWIWIIPLPTGVYSIGVVAPASAKIDLDMFVDLYLPWNVQRVEKVRHVSNIDYTCTSMYGMNWCLVGDAAYFVDPCWSSGVHLALQSARWAVDAHLEYLDCAIHTRLPFENYQTKMFSHEKTVTKLVEILYKTSQNKMYERVVWCGSKIPFLNRLFVRALAGDYDRKMVVNFMHFLSKFFPKRLTFPDFTIK